MEKRKYTITMPAGRGNRLTVQTNPPAVLTREQPSVVRLLTEEEAHGLRLASFKVEAAEAEVPRVPDREQQAEIQDPEPRRRPRKEV